MTDSTDKSNSATPEQIDLSITLDPIDIQQLQAHGIDPHEHLAMDLPAVQIQQAVDGKGQKFLALMVPIPEHVFVEKSRIVLPDGRVQNALDGTLALPPRIRILVRKDRLMEKAKEALRLYITDQLEVQAEQDPEG